MAIIVETYSGECHKYPEANTILIKDNETLTIGYVVSDSAGEVTSAETHAAYPNGHWSRAYDPTKTTANEGA